MSIQRELNLSRTPVNSVDRVTILGDFVNTNSTSLKVTKGSSINSIFFHRGTRGRMKRIRLPVRKFHKQYLPLKKKVKAVGMLLKCFITKNAMIQGRSKCFFSLTHDWSISSSKQAFIDTWIHVGRGN